MRVLGFDTATAATTVAVHDASTGETRERRDDPPTGERPRHTARLMALIAELLDETGWGWGEVRWGHGEFLGALRG